MGESTEYVDLRNKVISQIGPLLGVEGVDPVERFELSLRLSQIEGGIASYRRSFEAASALDDGIDKLRAYMDLLGEIDLEIQQIDDDTLNRASDGEPQQ